jgi:type IV fimbrial biogenesis protein FimT
MENSECAGVLDHQQGGRVLRTNQKGVTLIEAMVALVIMGVLIAAGLPSFGTFLQNRKVRNSAEAIQNGLQLAKAEAVRRNTVVVFNLAAGSSWNLTCANCSDVLPSMPATEMSPDVVTDPAAVALNFNGFGKVSNLAASATSTINISNSKGTCLTTTGGSGIRCLRIVVAPGGQIRTCDPMLPTSAAQACPA